LCLWGKKKSCAEDSQVVTIKKHIPKDKTPEGDDMPKFWGKV